MMVTADKIMGGNATFRAQAQVGKGKVSGKTSNSNMPGGTGKTGKAKPAGPKKMVKLGKADMKMISDLGISKKGYARNKAGM